MFGAAAPRASARAQAPAGTCLAFEFGTWAPPLDWSAAGHSGRPASHDPLAPNGRSWAAELPSGADTLLILFPDWWPAGVSLAFPRRLTTTADTLRGVARALVADSRLPVPTAPVRAWTVPCGKRLGGPRAAGARLRGLVFDPLHLRMGDTVGVWTADSGTVRAAGDTAFVGTIRLRGLTTVRGRIVPAPAGVAGSSLCLETDSLSAWLLPRAPDDAGPSRFCFDNARAARAQLGPTSGDSPVAVTIDRFWVVMPSTTGANRARFVSVWGRRSRHPAARPTTTRP